MIIFDLDGTLADCEHRRHFVDPTKDINVEFCKKDQCYYYKDIILTSNSPKRKHWHPNWQAFYEACDQDKPNESIILLHDKLSQFFEISIWSGRCESVREKTEAWLRKYTCPFYRITELKMRPIGDYTPDDKLKEKWLDEYNLNLYPSLELVDNNNIMSGTKYKKNDPIEMVFDDRDKVVAMWRRRGITCLQVAEGDF